MKKIILILFMVILMGCEEETQSTIAVSIVPQETFVKAVVGDNYDIITMIPPGYSPANYQPTPQEMAKFNEATIYFSIDVAAEAGFLDAANMTILDLADTVDAVYPARYFEDDEEADHEDHSHEGRDPHIWLSPKRAILMVETIRDTMVEIDPDNDELYEMNAQAYIKELQALDQELTDIFSQLENRAFIIYHPSYGYFADDYQLKMIAIEDEGKSATIQGIEEVIEMAQENDIRFIFYQEEFDNQQAELVAKEINGTTIKVAPLSGDYIESMRYISVRLQEILD